MCMCVFVMAVHLFFFPFPFGCFRFDGIFSSAEKRCEFTTMIFHWCQIDFQRKLCSHCNLFVHIAFFSLIWVVCERKRSGQCRYGYANSRSKCGIFGWIFISFIIENSFLAVSLVLSLSLLHFSLHFVMLKYRKINLNIKRSFKWFLHRSIEVVELEAAAVSVVVAWKFIN